ncbi:MAG: outer membrane protein [Hyphomicrobiaceae bacterium]
MKKVTAAMTGLALVAGSMLMVVSTAFADGADRKRSAKDDDDKVVVPVYRWGGLYVGAHLGGAWGDIDWNNIRSPLSSELANDIFPPEALALPDGARVSHSVDGFIGGGHIGIQHQFGRWVFGVEASLSGGDLEDRSSRHVDTEFLGGLINFHDRADVRTEMDWLILATARLGYTWDRWMAYVRGGYAQARIKISGDRDAALDVLGIVDIIEQRDTFSHSERHHGWTVGAGVEYMLTSNVTLGLEYNYIDLQSKRHQGLTSVSGTILPDILDIPFTDRRPFIVDVDPDAIHTLWARLSFKFNREEPVEPLK